MKAASRTKYYFAKYFFLAFGLLQWLIGTVIFFTSGELPKSQFASFIFFTIGLVLMCVFLLVAPKLKRVAIGKKKIVVIDGYRNLEYEWPEIKSIKLLPVFNIYRLKLKNKKGKIYFLPQDKNEMIFELFSSNEFTEN